MSVKQKVDVLDLIINVLREHEKTLDGIGKKFDSRINRLEYLTQELEQEILERKPELNQGRTFQVSTIIDLLEKKAFTSTSFTFGEKPSPHGNYFLIDHIEKQTLIFGESLARSNIPLWNIFIFHGTKEPYGKPLESNYFDSERMMLAWIIKYMLRKQKIEA